MNWTIGKRLWVGFGLAVIALIGLAAYSYTTMERLAALQHESASRANDSVRMTEAAAMGPRMYQIIADAIINRDLDATRKEWAEEKKVMADTVAFVNGAVDTSMEIALAKEASAAFDGLVAMFETRMMPVLESTEGFECPGPGFRRKGRWPGRDDHGKIRRDRCFDDERG